MVAGLPKRRIKQHLIKLVFVFLLSSMYILAKIKMHTYLKHFDFNSFFRFEMKYKVHQLVFLFVCYNIIIKNTFRTRTYFAVWSYL
jgi:hypothetical protein